MARRIVVFDPEPQKPKKGKQIPAITPKPDPRPAPKPKPAQKPVPVANLDPLAKPGPKPKPKQAPPPPAPDLSGEFAEAYRKDAAAAMDRARERAADKEREDRAFQAVKAEFLKRLLDGKDGFSALEEPFFWNEFKRAAELMAKRRDDKSWRKAGVKFARHLTDRFNKLRSRRDGYKLITPPLSLTECVFFTIGTMMFLERQIEAEPERAELGDLLGMYWVIYAKCFQRQGARLAEMIRKGQRLWKNLDTQRYLLGLEREKEGDA